MGRKRTKVDYRKLYKEHYNIEFGPDMVVHHIDFDRTNNSINNLLLLPSRLHAKYHLVLSMLVGIDHKDSLGEELQLNSPNVSTYYSQWLRNMADTLEEIAPWIRMKIDFDMLPPDVYRTVYHTGCPITENSVR